MFEIERYKFCPSCKEPFVKKGEKLLLCPACQLNYYINPVVGCNIIVVNEKQELLLVRRAHDPFKNTWDFPGGFTEPKETAEQAVVRETKEEIGIRLIEFEYYSSIPETYTYKGTTHHLLICFYITKLKKADHIVVNDDASGYCFFKKDEFPYSEISFSSIRKMLLNFKSPYA